MTVKLISKLSAFRKQRGLLQQAPFSGTSVLVEFCCTYGFTNVTVYFLTQHECSKQSECVCACVHANARSFVRHLLTRTNTKCGGQREQQADGKADRAMISVFQTAYKRNTDCPLLTMIFCIFTVSFHSEFGILNMGS